MNAIPITDFLIVLMIFMRISAALIASPIYGNQAVPVMAKLFLSLVIAYIVFLTIDKDSITISISGWSLFVNSIKEIITGLIIGYMMNMVFYGVSFAGTLIGFDLGLSMAQVFNPLEQENNNVVGEILYYGAMLVFFLINGHHYVISAMSYSFSVVPIGYYSITTPAFDLVIKYAGAVFVIAVKIASPIMVAFFLVHIAEGILARVIPQMQVFFVTQPVKIGLGLAVLAFIAPLYIYLIKNLLQDYENKLFILVQAMGK